MTLQWLADLPHATLLRHWDTAYLLVNAAHICAIGVLFGTIAALDLRLLGAARALPLSSAAPYLARMAASGLLLAVLTGFWLFSVQPAQYLGNTAFLAKLALIALGTLNALWLHAGRSWRRLLADAPVPPVARLHAALSILLWLAAIVAGRWIGFL
ncbi:DUF2214 domain-containing protein [Bordetella sp. BOR01]|uniref:DUF2214 domain-containing protein n=1 Tax=Bordetella sp. BOR01 TaxID=2854779 RepID=UPI001C47F2DC|nr:DUF2214 domain-containing protein [Bordetella sp. BOR01]MBV7486579.1 DUF2214 domain-containing protein [Bordetella sp. BOR01]